MPTTWFAPQITYRAGTAGTIEDFVGLATQGPPVDFQAGVDGTLLWEPELDVTWRAVLVDKDGTTLAMFGHGDAALGPIVETLNQTGEASITVSAASVAGRLIEATTVKPELEVQIWRGDRLWFFGPIIDPQPTDNHAWQCTLRDPYWFVTRSHVGKLGNQFGGVHPTHPERDYLLNPSFNQGLAGWNVLRTVSFGDYPGFGTPTSSMVTISRDPVFPGFTQCVKFDTPFGDPNDCLQLYQDIVVYRNPLRGATLRFSGWWWIKDGDNYAPTTQRFALLMAKLPDEVPLPARYYQPYDWTSTVLAEDIERGHPVYHECSIEIPPGDPVIVHVAICPPQGVSYFAGCELRGDDGIDYIGWDLAEIAGNLVLYAQDPIFDKGDFNIDQVCPKAGKLTNKTYIFEEHTNIGQAIDGLARDGYFDWGVTVTPTQRTFRTWSPRRGSYKPELRVNVNERGHGNVASIKVHSPWGSASTVVAAQSQTKGGKHEAAHSTGASMKLEEVFNADRDAQPNDLPMRAVEHLQVAAYPTTVEFTTFPGADDPQGFMVNLGLGDTIPIHSQQPGALVTGGFRIVRKETDPVSDTVTFTATVAP